MSDKVPCDCPKGGIIERENGSTQVCPKCDGTEWTTPKDESVLDAIKNDAMMEEAIASAELAQPPKDERTWASFKAEFLEPGSDCTWKQYPEPSAIMDFIHTHTTALAEEVVREIDELDDQTGPSNYAEDNFDAGKHEAYADALAIIRKHLTPDNPTEK